MSDNELELLTVIGNFKHKVSSTLNKSVEYASKNMFDENEDTCWNSDQGSPQYILIDFQRQVIPKAIKVTFQGGFVGQDGIIEIGEELKDLAVTQVLTDINDTNSSQSFPINLHDMPGRYMKISFPRSTDFYGRITIYSLQIYGKII